MSLASRDDAAVCGCVPRRRRNAAEAHAAALSVLLPKNEAGGGTSSRNGRQVRVHVFVCVCVGGGWGGEIQIEFWYRFQGLVIRWLSSHMGTCSQQHVPLHILLQFSCDLVEIQNTHITVLMCNRVDFF